MHGKPGTHQRMPRKIGRELLLDEFEEGRMAIARQSRLSGHPERRSARCDEFGLVDEAGLEHLGEHLIAPRSRPLRMPPRIVVGRASDQSHQQGDFGRIERLQLLSEPKLGAGGEAVHRLCTVLAKIDLVHIGLEDAPFVETPLEDDRDQRLVELAPKAALAPKPKLAGELLGDRGAALRQPSFAQIDPKRPQNRPRVDATVTLEAAILHRLQCVVSTRLGTSLKRSWPALLDAATVKGGDTHGIEPRLGEGPARPSRRSSTRPPAILSSKRRAGCRPSPSAKARRWIHQRSPRRS